MLIRPNPKKLIAMIITPMLGLLDGRKTPLKLARNITTARTTINSPKIKFIQYSISINNFSKN